MTYDFSHLLNRTEIIVLFFRCLQNLFVSINNPFDSFMVFNTLTACLSFLEIIIQFRKNVADNVLLLLNAVLQIVRMLSYKILFFPLYV